MTGNNCASKNDRCCGCCCESAGLRGDRVAIPAAKLLKSERPGAEEVLEAEEVDGAVGGAVGAWTTEDCDMNECLLLLLNAPPFNHANRFLILQ
jgi:hypothetical protein